MKMKRDMRAITWLPFITELHFNFETIHVILHQTFFFYS